MSFFNTLFKLERHVGLWLFIFLLTTGSMAVALYYQYALAWEPCVLCIHVRVIMLGLMAVSLLMVFLAKFNIVRLIGFLTQVALAVLLFVKCRELYRIEKGLEEAGCMFSAGLPSWFDLEAWWPSVFEVRSACGESPELLFNITMVEGLYIGSFIAMIAAILLSLLSILNIFKNKAY